MSEPLSSLARIASIIDLADVAFNRVVEHAQGSRTPKSHETQAQVYEDGYWIALAAEGHRPAEARRLAQDVRQLATSLRDLFKLVQGHDVDGIKDQYHDHSPQMNHVEACRATLVRVAKEFEKPGYDGPMSKLGWPLSLDRTKALFDEVSIHMNNLELDLQEGSKSEHASHMHHNRDSHHDGIMSVQSDTESIFDALSTGSSASSVGNGNHHKGRLALVQEYVNFLVGNPALERLILMCISPQVLGPQRFTRKYSIILQMYARDLREQAVFQGTSKRDRHSQAINFISRRSITMKVASLIASRYMEKAARPEITPRWTGIEEAKVSTESLDQQAESETSASSEDKTWVYETDQAFTIDILGLYFREGEPLQRMKRNLRDLLIPRALLSRVKSTTECILDLILGDEYLRFLVFKALISRLDLMGSSTLDLDTVINYNYELDPDKVISYFGSRLRAEACLPDQLHAAEFLETYSRYIGTRAIQRMKDMDMDSILDPTQASFIFFRKPDSPLRPV